MRYRTGTIADTVRARTEGGIWSAVRIKTGNDAGGSKHMAAPRSHYEDLSIRLQDNIYSFLGCLAKVE